MRLFLLIIMLATKMTLADIPSTMPFQGFLTESSGAPVTNTVSIDFALYHDQTAGSSIWQETHPSVNIVSGVFDVQLGAVVALSSILFDRPLFLGITVDGDSEMSPRTAVGSVAFSFSTDRLIGCPVGENSCSGNCTNLLTDILNCGSCGNNCNDNDVCTTNESCDGNGNCISSALNCDDGNSCTIDNCDPILGCTSAIITPGSSCSDGNVCTNADTCDGSGICTGSPVVCDDSNQCTIDSCDPLLGCSFANIPGGTVCDDGNLCTINDSCVSGLCTAILVICDDADPNTIDMCDPMSGICVFTPL